MPAPDNKPELITVGKHSLSIEQWAAKNKLKPATIRSRIRLGWDPAVAVTKRPDKRFSGGGNHVVGVPRPCPKLKRHTSGQAFSTWQTGSKRHYRYFGVYGTEEADHAYSRFASEWAVGQVRLQTPSGGRATLKELVVGYLTYAKSLYRKNGRVTGEYAAVKTAMESILRSCDSNRLCSQFTPADLRTCMNWMLGRGWARETINGNAGRIIRGFKWAAVEGYCSHEIHSILSLVPRFKRGQTGAPERQKKVPIPWSDVEATFKHLYPESEERRTVLEAMIRFHWLTGMRPQAICGMRPMDLDCSGPEWRYSVPDHINKTAHLDKELIIFIGPKAQQIIAPILANCPQERAVFALPPRGKNRPWVQVSRNDYAKWVKEACERAKVTPWTPHRMHHTHADNVRRTYESIHAAAVAIGDTEEVTERVYTSPNEMIARRIARELG